jgi:hypothetical protein
VKLDSFSLAGWKKTFFPRTPRSLSLRGWFFNDVDSSRRLKDDYLL